MLTGDRSVGLHKPFSIVVLYNNRIKQNELNFTSSCTYAMAISAGFPAVFRSGPALTVAVAPSAIAANLR